MGRMLLRTACLPTYLLHTEDCSYLYNGLCCTYWWPSHPIRSHAPHMDTCLAVFLVIRPLVTPSMFCRSQPCARQSRRWRRRPWLTSRYGMGQDVQGAVRQRRGDEGREALGRRHMVDYCDMISACTFTTGRVV